MKYGRAGVRGRRGDRVAEPKPGACRDSLFGGRQTGFILFNDGDAPKQFACLSDSFAFPVTVRAQLDSIEVNRLKNKEVIDVLLEECSKPPASAASGSGCRDDRARTLLVPLFVAVHLVCRRGRIDGADGIYWLLPVLLDRESNQPTEIAAVAEQAAD